MSQAKSKAASSVGLDAAIIENLQSVSVIGVYEDLTPIVSFVQENGLTRSLNNMLYYSAANDLGMLTRTSQQLSVVLDVINFTLGDDVPPANLPTKLSLLEELSRINEAYSMLCSNLRLVYKIYGMRKPAVTVSVTKILKSLVDYKNSTIFTQFMEHFDLNNSAVQNILVPTRDDFEKKIIDDKAMRAAFVDLWISICSTSNPTLRKALLTNFKIMNNFWKYMEMERFENINKILEFVDRAVCSEPTFKRATKCRILNENFLYSIRPLFSLVKSENDRQNDNDDIHDFNEFKVLFVKFMNTLVSDTNKGITYPENEFGSPLIVNNVTFSINNKLIYTLLTALKPWDSYVQLQFVMQILNHNHELVPPYMHWIVSHSGGYHDPALSSYWIGHTLLYTEILKSKQLPLKADFISLLPLSKTALTGCLTYSSELIQQLGLQIISLQLQKLTTSMNVPQSLTEYVMSNLPPQSAFIPLLNHQNKLIKLTATQIVAAQEELTPKSSSSATVGIISKELGALCSRTEKCDSFDLILIDKYLSIQSNNELKWWNKVSGENSFFTSLLKFSNVPLLRTKVFQILRRLTKPTLLFNEEKVIESPIFVLIEATAKFKHAPSAAKLWACLDETISRAVGMPYKYLDRSHKDYDDLSIFLVVLFEQINFVPDLHCEPSILEWLDELVTGMLLIGEPASGIKKSAQNAKVSVNLDPSSSKIPATIASKFEFAKAAFALNQVVQAGENSSKIFDLMNSLGQYLMKADLSDLSLMKFVLSPVSWGFFSRLGEETMSENETLATCLYGELIAQLDIDFTRFDLQCFIYELALTQEDKKKQIILKKFLWILSDDQLKTIANRQENELLFLEAYAELEKRDVIFNPDLIKMMKANSREAVQSLHKFEPSVEHIDLIIENPDFYFLLEKGSAEMAACLLAIDNLPDSLLYQISLFYPDVAVKYQTRVVDLALSMRNWLYSLRIFSSCIEFFDESQVRDLVFAQPEAHTRQSMNQEFVKFVSAVVSSQSVTPDSVRVWMHKAMLYITRKFAESDSLSENFKEFLFSLSELLVARQTLLSAVPVEILDSQLEVILASKKWSFQACFLEYVSHVVLAVKPKVLNSDKLLQVFVHNDKNPLHGLPNKGTFDSRFQASLIIYTLFHQNETVSSTPAFQESILLLYLGSQRAEDVLLKDVLQSIERRITQSWLTRVTNWDYQDEVSQEEVELIGEERLFIKDASSFVVALNKKFVKNTINANIVSPLIPKTKSYHDFAQFAQQCPSGTHQDTIYDPEFLMLLIINNEELVKESDGSMQFNMAKLVESDLLRFIITCLAHEKARDIARLLLIGIAQNLCEPTLPFKDRNLMKVFISSILHTLSVADHSVSLVWYVIGSFCSIIVNPNHLLYERVYHYILSRPIFKASTIPLFNLVMSGVKSDDALDEDDYQKSVSWLLGTIATGVKTSQDLTLLKVADNLECVLNIYNSKFVSSRLRSKVLALLYSIQRLGPEGSGLLLTRYGGFSLMEVLKRSAGMNDFQSSQERLNIDQLTLRIGELRGQKRSNEFSSGNIEHAVKRVHQA